MLVPYLKTSWTDFIYYLVERCLEEYFWPKMTMLTLSAWFIKFRCWTICIHRPKFNLGMHHWLYHVRMSLLSYFTTSTSTLSSMQAHPPLEPCPPLKDVVPLQTGVPAHGVLLWNPHPRPGDGAHSGPEKGEGATYIIIVWPVIFCCLIGQNLIQMQWYRSRPIYNFFNADPNVQGRNVGIYLTNSPTIGQPEPTSKLFSLKIFGNKND